MAPDGEGVDLTKAEVILLSSPFLACIETASAVAKVFKIRTISVHDQLADMMMKNWYPEDPFIGVTTKLTSNRERFTDFLIKQYDLKDLSLDYKRQTSAVTYPETVDQTNKR